MKRLQLGTLATALSLAAGIAAGQTVPILTGKDLNEDALIEALTPEPKTRTLRVQPAKPAAASLLITFPTNSATLTPEARESLDVVGRALRASQLADFTFSIEGHADPRGGADFNKKLSTARAQAVRSYLVSAYSIDSIRLRAVGKGDTELLNHQNLIAPENRRVTIKTLQ